MRDLKINYVSHPILSVLWCEVFGHRFYNRMWNAGGDEMCDRCTKYKNRPDYWTT